MKSYIIKVMCEGGVLGDQVFNKVTENVVIMRDGYAPLSYKEVCPVSIKGYGAKLCYVTSESSYLHNSSHGGSVQYPNQN